MSPRRFGLALVGGVALVLALGLLAQLGARANRAYEAAVAVRREDRTVTVLMDRVGRDGVLGVGWTAPVAGRGAESTGPAAYITLPTSIATGDVQASFVLASAGPRAQPMRILVGETPVGAWTPKGDGPETVAFVVPGAVRSRSYDLDVVLDLAGGPPIRIVSAATRIVEAPPN